MGLSGPGALFVDDPFIEMVDPALHASGMVCLALGCAELLGLLSGHEVVRLSSRGQLLAVVVGGQTSEVGVPGRPALCA